MAEKGQLSVIEVKFWSDEANSCELRQKRELIERNNYPFLINYYEGYSKIDPIHPHVSTKQRMAIINEFFPNTNALITDLIFKNPDIMLEAMKPQAEEDTPLMKSALTYFFDKADGLVEHRVALFDMLYAGYSAVEVDLMPQDKDEADTSVDEEPEEKSMIGKVVDKVKKAVTVKDVERNIAALAPPMEANFATVQGSYIRRYDPLDVPLDWRAERVKDRRYNLKKIWMSKAEFDSKYPKFKDEVHEQDARFEYSRHDLTLHNRKVLLHEFQVRMKDNKYQTIILSPTVKTREIDTFVRPYNTNGFNMKIGTLHKYGKLYPRSFAQINKKMSDEMNHYVRHMMDVAERNIPKRMADKGKVKGDAITALNSTKTNDLALIDGSPANALLPVPHTNVSIENKELLSIFQDQKNKLWSVSEPKIAGQSQAKFMGEIAMQEMAFKEQNVDLQEGLRMLINQVLDTGKDLIAEFWDDEVFLKVTGHPKMEWYEPQLDTQTGRVLNPLAEQLTADYNVKVDIASAARPNKDQQLQRMIFYMQQVIQMLPVIQAQGKTINVEEIQRLSKEFGWNPDKVFIAFKPAEQPTVPAQTGESISPEEDAQRQAEAEARVSGGG